jgi:hypothetical protein
VLLSLLTIRVAAIPHVVRSINYTPHSALPRQHTPAYVVFGQKARPHELSSDDPVALLAGSTELSSEEDSTQEEETPGEGEINGESEQEGDNESGNSSDDEESEEDSNDDEQQDPPGRS